MKNEMTDGVQGWTATLRLAVEGHIGEHPFTFGADDHGWRFGVMPAQKAALPPDEDSVFRSPIFHIGADHGNDALGFKGPGDVWRMVALCVAKFHARHEAAVGVALGHQERLRHVRTPEALQANAAGRRAAIGKAIDDATAEGHGAEPTP